MKVSEAVQHMTKWYLHRIIDSFARDFPKPDEDQSRDIIVKNVDELTNPERIRRTLSLEDHPYAEMVLHEQILRSLLARPNHSATDQEVIDAVRGFEERVLGEAAKPDSLKYEDKEAVEILRTVLEVAIEDERITREELELIRRLRQKLRIKEGSTQIILAQLGHFPRAGNRLHTPSEFNEAFNDLQRRGVVFYCNKLDGGRYVIPDEIVAGVRQALGIELSERPWRVLLDNLTKQQLESILKSEELPSYGVKEQLIDRIVQARFVPSVALDALQNAELYEVLNGLPGAKVSGSKEEKIQRIIDYFANLVVKDVEPHAPVGERYYEYLVELANRDRENLLANKVIKKDREMDSAFEDGTRYLFREKLGCQLLEMPGSDHPDGCIDFGVGTVFMWDTKSKEGDYTFPESHLKQFKRYIRDSAQRVSCFLVIAPRVEDSANERAARLKVESRTDTDVALISAEDLKWVAEEWRKYAKTDRFDLEIFNITGVLSRQQLQTRMRLFL